MTWLLSEVSLELKISDRTDVLMYAFTKQGLKNPTYEAIEKPLTYRNDPMFHQNGIPYCRDLFEIAKGIKLIPRVENYGKSNTGKTLEESTDHFRDSKEALN